jgi:hypothetical protein
MRNGVTNYRTYLMLEPGPRPFHYLMCSFLIIWVIPLFWVFPTLEEFLSLFVNHSRLPASLVSGPGAVRIHVHNQVLSYKEFTSLTCKFLPFNPPVSSNLVLRCCSAEVLQSKPKQEKRSSLLLTLNPHPDGSIGRIGSMRSCLVRLVQFV